MRFGAGPPEVGAIQASGTPDCWEEKHTKNKLYRICIYQNLQSDLFGVCK